MTGLSLVAGILLLQLALLSGCAQLSTESSATAGTDAIAVESLAGGGMLATIATDEAFDFGSAVLRSSVPGQLSLIVVPYAQRNGMQAVVSGYTDNVGAADYNLELSRQRARAVADALLAQGFRADQILVEGHGEADPLASNADATGRYRNRRVEVLITVGDE